MRFLTLLLVYALTAFSTFGFMTHFMKLENFLPAEYAIYAGGASAFLALVCGLLLLKKPRVEEDEDEEEEEVIEKAEKKAVNQEPLPEKEEEVLEDYHEETPVEETAEEHLRDNIVDVKVEPFKKPEASFVNDTTTVINTIADNDPFVPEEKPVKMEARRPAVELISPLGPRTITPVKEEEPELETSIYDLKKEDDMFDTAAFQHLAEDTAKLETVEEKPVEEVKTNDALSNTQETYISDSKVSYIDEDGRPQFRVTQQYKPVNDDGYDYNETSFAESKEDRLSDILNKVITVLVIALVLVGLYLLYVRFFG